MFHLDEDQLNGILSLLDKYPDKDEWELAEMMHSTGIPVLL